MSTVLKSRLANEILESTAETGKLKVWFNGECRTTSVYRKKNHGLVYWSPFTGERVAILGPKYKKASVKAKPIIEYQSESMPIRNRRIERAIQAKCPVRETVRLKEIEYTPRQLEHFGDALFLVAARIISHELFGTDWNAYKASPNGLISNLNIGLGNLGRADEIEEEIGRIMITKGASAALEEAVAVLRLTDHYLKLLKEAEAWKGIGK